MKLSRNRLICEGRTKMKDYSKSDYWLIGVVSLTVIAILIFITVIAMQSQYHGQMNLSNAAKFCWQAMKAISHVVI